MPLEAPVTRATVSVRRGAFVVGFRLRGAHRASLPGPRHNHAVSPDIPEVPEIAGSHVDRDVEVERLDLGEGAWVDVARGWMVGADDLFDALRDEVAVADQPAVPLRPLRRGAAARRRTGSGARRCPTRPWPRRPACCSTATGPQFPGFGMIQYRDGRDGQAFHRDTDMKWLDDTVIGILSLGAQPPLAAAPPHQPPRPLPRQGRDPRPRARPRATSS